MDPIGPVVSSVAPYLVDPIVRQFKYLFLLSDNVKAIVNAMDELRAKRESIKIDIQNAEREDKDCSPEVALWLQKVETIQREVLAIKQAYDQRKKCIEIISLNVVSNYKIGRQAFKKIEEVMHLLNKDFKFEDVAKKLPTGHGSELPTPKDFGEVPMLEMIYHYLKENIAGIVGIWGMGGVGKTTLLRRINNKLVHNKDGMFDHVIWVVVSRNNAEKIRSDIAKFLGLSSADAGAICNFLRRKSFLLLLDDLWSSLDLESIGVPEIDQHDAQDKKKRMVVFTTRSEAICGSMEANKKIKMECLDDNAAWSLFKEKAGKELIESDKQIQHHAEDITKKCAGLPLALVTVGKAMSTKKTPGEWEYVATMMRKSKYQNIPGMKESNLFPILKISYDSLGSDSLRQCFLYCSLWGEDEQIPIDELIECWMGHGLLDGFDELNEAYNQGETIIGILKEACLLESGVVERLVINTSELRSNVKVHDMIRDLALWITSGCQENNGGWLVKPHRSLERLPQDLNDREAISLAYNRIRSLHGSPNFHKLRTFILQGNKELCHISSSFFVTMHSLKYLDLSRTCVTSLPEEIGMLHELQYLNLSFSSLISLPRTLGDLNKLKYLYCGEAKKLKRIPGDLIARLKNLNVLDLYSTSFYFYEGAYLDDLLSLSNLKGVGFNIVCLSALEKLSHVPKQRVLLSSDYDKYLTSISISPSLLGSNSKANLQELDIFSIEGLKELVMTTEDKISWCLSQLKSLNLAFLRELRDVIWEDLEPSYFLPKLAYLEIYECHQLTSLCWVAQLPYLQILVISKCRKLRCIIAGDGHTMMEKGTPFQRLKTLLLVDLPNLESIYEGELSFPSITTISFTNCWKLRNLPLGLHSAKNLEYISVDPLNLWDDMDWAFKHHFSHFVLKLSNVNISCGN
ncbi:P-loop containing nucleoside triphosphate hydrolase protein [Dioscorea alata]|uniref:P-loop containing nucleoside triphosphate hydrolase protein n=1 Tax=Dioscorea alata TaxID=55571 RepID=A0ACB7ULY0_DIOAL|nr:P-loop containing nucleoside triphosphate hydrolase protein [Dioscorea alata]